MTGEDMLLLIADAKYKYIKTNKKLPDYLIISQNLYFRLYEYFCKLYKFNIECFDKKFILDMEIKLIDAEDFLMVGCNEILKRKGGKDE